MVKRPNSWTDAREAGSDFIEAWGAEPGFDLMWMCFDFTCKKKFII
jgi:hypothetical protein